ncbi:gamma-glutamyltransferase [Roseomonas sp. AR75]|uniref:gamma-glutamyltransferase n=1 Tax=Roseomonas sp. AR75 TaxID=2562311 RepID=UPI0019816145|nr:gamma-glutamyltransferase [Roseomonas sp. AR75]
MPPTLVGRNGFPLVCEKQPARGARGVVCSNHPLASAAGAEVLLAGGNAVDAAIATLFALTVVEPMMVGLTGGGVCHLRMADGTHAVLDGLSAAPAAATPEMYRPIPGSPPEERETEGKRNAVGALSVAVPAALRGWTHALARHGTWPLADVMEPAIRLASRGFRVTPYLSDCIADAAADLARDADLAARFLPGGSRLEAGTRLVQGAYAETLRAVAQEGPDLLHGGALGRLMAEALARQDGIVTLADLAGVRTLERAPIRGTYRGFEVFGPPPPASAGVHVAQMLNVLEDFDVAAQGFGTVEGLHLVAEVLKMAFADRAVATADPDFVRVPVAMLTSKDYAARRRAMLHMAAAQAWQADPTLTESNCTTHVTVADAAGNIVATTQTINALFGARIAVPGTGLICNNYMHNFDPRPDFALSVAPGKRVYTSMAPTIVLKDGAPRYALGLPGGLRIFPSAFQALLNLIDHAMPLQEALEAPRIWTMGNALELEPAIPDTVAEALAAMGHAVKRVKTIGGGINGIAFEPDGSMTGAACWRADGSVAALGGGLARAGVRFSTEPNTKAPS